MSLPDLRPGATIQVHSLILGVTPFQEKDRIVQLLTPAFGKISGLAKNAAQSKRRFGGSLEPCNHVIAHLVVPRDTGGEAPLWRLDQVELKSGFPALRESFARLETALYAVALVRDLLPEGQADEQVFRTLGQFLKTIEGSDFDAQSGWARVAFFGWFSRNHGYGDLSELVEPYLASRERALEFWRQWLAQPTPRFDAFLEAFRKVPDLKLLRAHEIEIYRKWVALSGVHWSHFERWSGMSSFGTSPRI